MDAFWKWLMRANARGVLIGGVIVLLLVCCWWGWREFTPLESEKAMKRKRGSEDPRDGLGIISFLDDQLSARFNVSEKNPFFTRVLPSPPEMPPVLPEVGIGEAPVPPMMPERGRPTRRPFARLTKPVVPVVPKPEPKGEVVTLEYKGIFKRSDGRTLALLRDSKSESSRFYAVGADLHGMKVAQFSQNRISIVRHDGTMAGVKLGEPTDFELPMAGKEEEQKEKIPN